MDPYSTRLCTLDANTNNLFLLYILAIANFGCWPFGTLEGPWYFVDTIGTGGTKVDKNPGKCIGNMLEVYNIKILDGVDSINQNA